MTTTVQEFIEHYGTKGMRWGVRRAAKSSAKADKKWQKNIYSTKGAIAVHNATADKINADIDALNARHPKADINASVQSKATRNYIREYETLVAKATKDAVTEVHGTSPSGTLKATLDTSDPEQWKVRVDAIEVEHAFTVIPAFSFNVDQTSDGHVGDAHSVEEILEQSAIVNEFIEHYGTKGMRWGVRRPRGDRSAFRERAKAAASDKGEGRHKERTVFGKAPERLTNAQLEARIKRMDMEKRYNDLNKRDVSAGEKFAVEVATNVGKQVLTNIATSTLTTLGSHAVKQVLSKKTKLPIGELFKKK